jgi:hypothetical protein
MDRKTGTPVEQVQPQQPLSLLNNTLPDQTAASTEVQAHAEVDKHGVVGEEPSGGEAARDMIELGTRPAGVVPPSGEAPITTKARKATAGKKPSTTPAIGTTTIVPAKGAKTRVAKVAKTPKPAKRGAKRK